MDDFMNKMTLLTPHVFANGRKTALASLEFAIGKRLPLRAGKSI
jgi:hypothetical protein